MAIRLDYLTHLAEETPQHIVRCSNTYHLLASKHLGQRFRSNAVASVHSLAVDTRMPHASFNVMADADRSAARYGFFAPFRAHEAIFVPLNVNDPPVTSSLGNVAFGHCPVV